MLYELSGRVIPLAGLKRSARDQETEEVISGLVSLIDRSILSKAYFSREHVARHQLDSFNYFLKHNLQKVVNEQRIIETDIENRGKNNEAVWVNWHHRS